MKSKYLIYVFLGLSSFVFSAQDGSLDTSFGNNGVLRIDINGNSDHLTDISQDSNGRIIIVGSSYVPNSSDDFRFLRVHLENGEVDSSFGTDGMILQPLDGNWFRQVLVQSNQMLLTIHSNPFEASRFLVDGQQDMSYGNNGSAQLVYGTEVAKRVIIDNQDRIIVMGHDLMNGTYYFYIRRFLDDGSIDPTYGVNGIQYFPTAITGLYSKYSPVLMDDGRFVVIYNENASAPNKVARFLQNGTLDPSFGVNGVATVPLVHPYRCYGDVMNNGSVLVSCSFWDSGLDTTFKHTVKIKSNGASDTNFGDDGILHYRLEFIQENQRFIANRGYINEDDGVTLDLSRFNGGGSVDNTFQFSGGFSEDLNLNEMKRLTTNSGKFIIASTTMWYNGNLDVVLIQFNNTPLSTDDNKLSKVSITPNPSSGKFTLQYNYILGSNIPYFLTDISGKILMQGKLSGDREIIDISNFQVGLYFLKTASYALRLIKE